MSALILNVFRNDVRSVRCFMIEAWSTEVGLGNSKYGVVVNVFVERDTGENWERIQTVRIVWH